MLTENRTERNADMFLYPYWIQKGVVLKAAAPPRTRYCKNCHFLKKSKFKPFLTGYTLFLTASLAAPMYHLTPYSLLGRYEGDKLHLVKLL